MSSFVILIAHLLKWRVQPRLRSRSWRNSITEHRRRILAAVADEPALRPDLDRLKLRAWPRALALAADETGFPQRDFPDAETISLAYILSQSLEDDDGDSAG